MEVEKEYVFIVNQDASSIESRKSIHEMSPTGTLSSSDTISFTGSDDTVTIEESCHVDEVPCILPFLPAMNASTEIKTHDGYAEAIVEAQQILDSRLLAFSQYLNITNGNELLLTPRKPILPLRGSMNSNPFVGERPVTVCMGWQRVSNIDSNSREMLRILEEDGVSYVPHDLAYSVKYLAPVAPFGDCMFLSIEQLLLYSEECQPLSTSKIRRVAAKFFMAHYNACTQEEQGRINTAIRNLYYPSLEGGWGVSPIQTRRFVAKKSDRDWLYAKCLEYQEQGYSRVKAAEMAYSRHAQPVLNVESYCDYMSVGNEGNTHFIIAISYSQSGLVSVDSDPDHSRVAWGDDFALEALATAYQRDIFVVLVGCGQMFFLPHRPRNVTGLDDSECMRSKGNAPWYLLMRLTGSDRGGDHYEPMLGERLRGDGSSKLGCIGD